MPSKPSDTMEVQLEKIRMESKLAAQELLGAFENILDSCDAIRAQSAGQPDILAHLAEIYQTGSIQDVLRQRLEKIVRITARIADPSLPDDDPLLAGPQAPQAGSGMDQDAINRMMGDFDEG